MSEAILLALLLAILESREEPEVPHLQPPPPAPGPIGESPLLAELSGPLA